MSGNPTVNVLLQRIASPIVGVEIFCCYAALAQQVSVG